MSSKLVSLLHSREALPLAEFCSQLRVILLADPGITLAAVAQSLGVTRQRVASLVGPLGRPNCCPSGPRPAPKRDRAAEKMVDLRARVAAGESAESVARALGLSLSMAMQLGFRAKDVRPAHGTKVRWQMGCNCWRCRRVAGVAVPRARKVSAKQRATALDWLAWVDPDDGRRLSQTEIGKMVGIGQMVVSRILRAAEVGA
jgi:hypothetical protein